MSKEIPGNHLHLTLSDRVYIEQSLYMGMSFKEIAHFLEKDPTTISKEVRRFVAWRNGYSASSSGVNCAHYDTCRMQDLCFVECGQLCRDCQSTKCPGLCSSYSPVSCSRLESPPFVCNGCHMITQCRFEKCLYSGESAHNRYRELLSASRQGINASPEEINRIDGIITPLIKKGQPLSHIYAHHGSELGCSRQTLYNYIDMSLFSVGNLDLPRRVRYRIRRSRRSLNPVRYEYRNRRTYRDFEKFSEAFPDYEVVELDTVKGTREAGKCLLTMFFRSSSLMLIFLLPSCTQGSVRNVFDFLYERLGPRIFKKTFRIILTDNGPEFKDPWSIERGPHGEIRTHVFYCDPYQSNQKGKLEKNHEFIRYVIPKGRSMHSLTDEKVRLLACHVNSVARDSLGGLTPFDMAETLINKKVLHLLGLRKVSADKVILRPALLK